MSPRKLDEPMRAYRIGDPGGRYKVFSGEGAKRVEGRWHKRGQEVIYTSQRYATAMLETLAHYNGVLPPNQHYIKIEIPAGISYEVITKDTLPGWASASGIQARAFGSSWLTEARSLILFVPSVPAIEETNVLINATHPEFLSIRPGLETPVRWDARLL